MNNDQLQRAVAEGIDLLVSRAATPTSGLLQPPPHMHWYYAGLYNGLIFLFMQLHKQMTFKSCHL